MFPKQQKCLTGRMSYNMHYVCNEVMVMGRNCNGWSSFQSSVFISKENVHFGENRVRPHLQVLKHKGILPGVECLSQQCELRVVLVSSM